MLKVTHLYVQKKEDKAETVVKISSAVAEVDAMFALLSKLPRFSGTKLALKFTRQNLIITILEFCNSTFYSHTAYFFVVQRRKTKR